MDTSIAIDIENAQIWPPVKWFLTVQKKVEACPEHQFSVAEFEGNWASITRLPHSPYKTQALSLILCRTESLARWLLENGLEAEQQALGWFLKSHCGMRVLMDQVLPVVQHFQTESIAQGLYSVAFLVSRKMASVHQNGPLLRHLSKEAYHRLGQFTHNGVTDILGAEKILARYEKKSNRILVEGIMNAAVHAGMIPDFEPPQVRKNIKALYFLEKHDGIEPNPAFKYGLLDRYWELLKSIDAPTQIITLLDQWQQQIDPKNYKIWTRKWPSHCAIDDYAPQQIVKALMYMDKPDRRRTDPNYVDRRCKLLERMWLLMEDMGREVENIIKVEINKQWAVKSPVRPMFGVSAPDWALAPAPVP